MTCPYKAWENRTDGAFSKFHKDFTKVIDCTKPECPIVRDILEDHKPYDERLSMFSFMNPLK